MSTLGGTISATLGARSLRRYFFGRRVVERFGAFATLSRTVSKSLRFGTGISRPFFVRCFGCAVSFFIP